ncbi:O-methylsterigmatocystin oxidoreductase [Coprinopsis sp. MPI-PUGE-AT-0042]|nr:O-methylsterigmatocystin oxidoreductase [Coprinopsis sp. MPI-PUGE-AT-0042]
MLDLPLHTQALGWLLTIGVLALMVLRGRRNTRGLPLPPGPRGLPLLGNVFQLPSEKPWKAYSEWSKVYGDMIYLEVPGQPLLILNSLDDCLALLEKRGVNYSDRGQSISTKLMDLATWNWAFEAYGPRLKEYRRVFHQLLGPKQVPQYRPVMEEEVLLFLQHLLSTPADFADHVRMFVGSFIIRIAYGSSDAELNRTRIEEGERLVDGFVKLTHPGRLLVELIPVLRFVPTWFPGARWKREIEKVRAQGYQVAKVPFDEAKERLEGGMETGGYPSMVQRFLSSTDAGLSENERRERDELGRFTMSLSFLAGADTSIITGLGLFGALAMHPEVQLKAYAEIGRVIGHDRLPQLHDLEQLPYIRAIIKEIARWFVVTPFAIPHLSREDDEYKGYFIPKGTAVLPNAWAVLNDPTVFINPQQFNPDRYLGQDGGLDATVLDPEMAAFGFGRRICPGRHLSFEITALMIASLLAVFEVKPPLDESGEPIMHWEMETSSEFLSNPLPFKCQIVPRSERHAALLG